jgi:hypothetical protein
MIGSKVNLWYDALVFVVPHAPSRASRLVAGTCTDLTSLLLRGIRSLPKDLVDAHCHLNFEGEVLGEIDQSRS